MSLENRIYSAVVEASNFYIYQTHRLVWSLINEAKVPVEQIILHSILPVSEMKNFTSMGIKVIQIKRFKDHPWCNKINQLDSLAKEDFFDAVLLDTDTLVLKEPPRAKVGFGYGKPVDFANPSTHILKKIYEEAELTWVDACADIDKSITVHGNVNGGVYVMHKDFLIAISKSWEYWARWLLKNKHLLEKGRTFLVDQISFAMAISELQLPFEELDRKYNIPINEYNHQDHLDRIPSIIHYHGFINDDGTIKTVNGLENVNSEIMRVNSLLSDYLIKNNLAVPK